jgi:hypothetical protein
MGAVKGFIEELTYVILSACNIEDTVDNYHRVFNWVRKQKFADMTDEELITLYKKEKQI